MVSGRSTIAYLAYLVGCVATSKRTITPIYHRTQTQLDIRPNLADKSLQQSIDEHLKIAIQLVLGTIDDALDCSGYNHNVEQNQFRLESNVPKIDAAKDYAPSAFYENLKRSRQVLTEFHNAS